jgi:hypothetical protein
MLELTEVASFQDRSTVVSAGRLKRARQEFKNANYILQVTRNRGRFRVPLMMFLEYKGFGVLAKAKVHSTEEYASLAASLQQDMTQFERDTRIGR